MPETSCLQSYSFGHLHKDGMARAAAAPLFGAFLREQPTHRRWRPRWRRLLMPALALALALAPALKRAAVVRNLGADGSSSEGGGGGSRSSRCHSRCHVIGC